MKTHWKKLANYNYLGSHDLEEGEERLLTIDHVVNEEVTAPDGTKEKCIVAHLKNEKPFILNATNAKMLSDIFGSPYVEDWAGKQFLVRISSVRAFGQEMPALRVMAKRPEMPSLEPGTDKWKRAVAALKSGRTTIDKIKARYSITAVNEKRLNKEGNGDV